MTSRTLSCAIVLALTGLIGCSGSQTPEANGAGASGKGGGGGNSGSSGGGNGGSGASVGAGGSSGGAGGTAGRPTMLPPLPAGCSLDKPAFCETFDNPQAGGRGGEIDETKWAFSRWGFSRGEANSRDYRDGVLVKRWSNPDGPPTMCGQEFSKILPPNDARICNGQFNEVFKDGQLPINSFMVRRPFDFAGRTGTIVFDVDAKRNDGWDGHGWWLEVWITEDPAPIPYHGAPTVGSTPRNGVGFQIAPTGDAFARLDRNSLNKYVVTRDYNIRSEELFDDDPPESVTIKVKDTFMNRFKVMLSQDALEIWGSDYDSQTLHLMGKVTGLGLNFTMGYVHFQHVHYNASKTPNCDCDDGSGAACGLQACWASPPEGDPALCCWANPDGIFASNTQAFRWDNIGFDGPVYPMVRGYDVQNNNVATEGVHEGVAFKNLEIGYSLGRGGASAAQRFQVTGVDLTDAQRATFNFSYSAWPGVVFRYRFNGKAWHDFTTPQMDEDGVLLRAFTLDAPLAELVNGTNTIEVQDNDSGNAVGNLDITVHPSK